ncbi:MAG TPA: hypothetical protein VH596_09005 [Terriglobales bacterium]|jgi:hypothetical protein
MSENKPDSSWEAIARRVSVEQDPQKLNELTAQLIEALNEQIQEPGTRTEILDRKQTSG